jgi:serine/threonine protein kinase
VQNIPDTASLETSIPEAVEITFIDSGGFKAVYKALIDQKTEALKVIFIPNEEDQPEAHSEIQNRIKREIESLRVCDSPYLVKLGSLSPRNIELGENNYIIYSEEYLNGSTLKNRIREGYRPGLLECKTLSICLLEVIKELKRNNIVHRDIKPGNVICLGEEGRPFVVLDLGIAYKMNSTAITINPEMRQGTLPYMAPEIFGSRFRDTFDFRSDLYSAAVTIYEYATGIHPFARRGEDSHTTIYRILNSRPTPLSELRPDYPLQYCQIIDQLIRKTPALRPSNIEGVIKTIGEIR